MTEINTEDRRTYAGLLGPSTPSPDTYLTNYSTSSKLAVRIKGQYPEKQQKLMTEAIGKPTERKIPKKPNSIFQTSIPRDIYPKPDVDTPGPGAFNIRQERTQSPSYVRSAFGNNGRRFSDSKTDSPSPADHANIREYQQGGPNHSVFASRSLPPSDEGGTPAQVGPGRYDPTAGERMRPQKSPAFADRSVRMGSDDNGIPGAADYTLAPIKGRSTSVLNERYPRVGNWMALAESCAPSPENYSVARPLNRGWTMARAGREAKKAKKDRVGPGTYETATTAFRVRSYNAGVPGAFQ